jgi:Prenyltransferase and squalene oxidase repeat
MQAEAEELQRRLIQAQNADGGWGYKQGTSWTEPTALALLALAGQKNTGEAYQRGCSWLHNTQKADGGWAPSPGLDASTWVTSIAILARPDAELHAPRTAEGVRWMLGHENGETPMLEGLFYRMFGAVSPKAPGGSPWYPSTAAWIAPSTMSVLALARVERINARNIADREELGIAIRRAQRYILSRRCRDGGWNHGGSPYRSEDAESYPEMTGMALLALQGVPPGELAGPLARAQAFLAEPQSAEALSWLQLGLRRHGHSIDVSKSAVACRTQRDACLRLLALTAPDNGLFSQGEGRI